MKRSSIPLRLCFFLTLLFIQNCASTPPETYDYAAYLEHTPRSILVLPPRNETTEVMAPYVYMSTISRVLAERGYYIFPVAVVNALMLENGVPTPDEMAQVPLKKIKEVIGPDAVLYLTLLEWGTKYRLIDTRTIIRVKGRLVDTDTGTLIWQGEHTKVQGSSAYNNQGIVEMMVAAIIEKIATSIVDPARDLAYRTNFELFNNQRKGLPAGRRHQNFEEDRLRLQTSNEIDQKPLQ